MTDSGIAGKVLLELIRGNVPLSFLGDVGISVSFERDLGSTTIKIESGLSIAVSPTISDIIQGLGNVPRGRDLREWASFIQATDLINFDEIEKHPQSDKVLNALWDASFDGSVDSTTMDQLSNIAQQ